MSLHLFAVALVSTTLAAVFTPLAIRVAYRTGWLDLPTGWKTHREAVPLLGGSAVAAAFVLTVLVLGSGRSSLLPLVAGVLAMWATGTIDDRRPLPASFRLLIEGLAGLLLWSSGHGWQLGLPDAVAAVLTVVWVIGVINAVNLLDLMDGVAASTTAVCLAAAASLALLAGHKVLGLAALAGAGGALGFLPYNLAKPPRVFLGDGGSMPLGFLCAAVTMGATPVNAHAVAQLFTCVLVLLVPIFDMVFRIALRLHRGTSLMEAGPDSLMNRIRSHVTTPQAVCSLVVLAQGALATLAIATLRLWPAAIAFEFALVLAGTVLFAAWAQTSEGAVRVGSLAAATGEDLGAAQPPTAAGTSVLDRLSLAAVAVLGLGAGVSPLFSGYYDTGVWVPIGLVLVVVAASAAIARTPTFTGPAKLALAGVAGLGVWSLLSASWSEAVEPATVDANRWLWYAALLLLVIALIRDRRHAHTLLIAIGAGIAVVAASVLVRLLGSDPGGLFLIGRLNSPLGYVNGEACVFAMGSWLSLAVAEQRRPVLAGLGAAGTVVFACLTMLSESRGAAIATFTAIVIALILIPGARRRLLALTMIAVGVAFAAGSLVHLYSVGQAGRLTASVVHTAVARTLGAAVAVGLMWGLLVSLAAYGSRRGGRPAVLLRRCANIACLFVVLVPVGIVATQPSSIEHAARTQWHAFVHLSDEIGTESRLFTGAGNRYDYWRIAWNVFLNHPLVGVGAGNYTQSYFRERRTAEAIQNPHSIELQTLSELGLIGAVLLSLLVAGITLGTAQLRRVARGSVGARATLVAVVGAATVWLVDTSGDWMHELPGVTAIALAAVAVLCQYARLDHVESRAAEQRQLRARLPTLASAAAVALVLAITGATLLRSGLTDFYLNDAKSELAAQPVAAIADAGRALQLDSANLDAYYVKAAGEARFDQAAAARATLLDAAQQDPGEYVTWVLLGDLEVRAGVLAAAKVYYGHAHALDPNDPAVAQLAADPARALSSARS